MYKLILVMLLATGNADAITFGANNYEECMSDGKVGRTNDELHLLMNKCHLAFPKLPKLHAMQNAKILCVGPNEETESFSITKDKIYTLPIKSGGEVSIRTPKKIVGNIDQYVYFHDKTVQTRLTIETLTGVATWYLEIPNGNPPTIYYDCTEQ